MLHQKRSGNLARLKYLVAVPIGAALLCTSTLGFSKTYGWIDLAPHKPIKSAQNYQESPPNVIENVYVGLMNHISKNIKYKQVDANKSGFMLVDFTITNDHKLTDVSVRKTVPPLSLREQIASLFKSYKGSINDSPGKHVLSLIFNTGNDRLRISPSIQKLPGYSGEIELNVPAAPPNTPNIKTSFFTPPPPPIPLGAKKDVIKFPPPIPVPDMPGGFKPEKTYINKKGFKIEEGGYTANGKTFYRVIISDPSGKKVRYLNGVTADKLTSFKGTPNKKEIKMLDEKYGYKFPDVKVTPWSKIDQVKFPPPIVRPDKPTPLKTDQVRFPPPIVKDKAFINDLARHLGKTVRYPAEAKEKDIRGHVIVEIKIKDHAISGARVIKSIGYGFDEEVLRSVNLYKDKAIVEAGTYVLALAFELDSDKPNAYPALPSIDDVKKAPNYIGEVVIVGYKTSKRILD